MARPKKEGMDYFPHDVDAVSDEKIEALRTLYGNDGYAFYFIMLERIYRSNNFELDVSDAETREETFQILSKKILVTKELFERMLKTALKWGCFDKIEYDERGVITSNGIKKRALVVTKKRVAMKERYKKSISAAETSEEIDTETTQSKVKESKVKESKVKESIEDSNSSNETVNVIEYYRNNINPLPKKLELDILLSFADDLSDEMIVKAIDEAILHNKRNMSYIRAILNNWVEEGYKTVEEIVAAKDIYKQNKAGKNYNKSTKFTDYPQRDYDWEALEDDLREASMKA